MIKIDYNKSIQKQRLVVKTTFLDKLGVFCIWIFGSLSFILISLSMLYGSLKFNWFYESAIQIILVQLICFSISAFVAIGLIRNNYLTKIRVSSNDQAKVLVRKSVEIFKSYSIECDNDRELVVDISPRLFANGREIIVLFDKNDIYLNCKTYGRTDLISPIHWVVNKRIIAKLVKEIKAQQYNRHE